MTEALSVTPPGNHADTSLVARHFRQILLWPLQLMRLSATSRLQRPWEELCRDGSSSVWSEVEDEFTGDPSEFQERHYREFVTFLPHVQRFLYGQGRSSSTAHGYGDSPMRVFRRSDIKQAGLTHAAFRILPRRFPRRCCISLACCCHRSR